MEINSAEENYTSNEDVHRDKYPPRWKIRKPVLTDEKNEENEWRENWQQRYLMIRQSENELDPLEYLNGFKALLDDIFGRYKWSPRAKRWWNNELEGERQKLAQARRKSTQNTAEFREARNRWFRAIRKAKRECWEKSLQQLKRTLIRKSTLYF